MAPSTAHQLRIDHAFRRVFPALVEAGVRFEYRWGGLQCFTADSYPLCGAVTPSRRVWTLAGLSGKVRTHACAHRRTHQSSYDHSAHGQQCSLVPRGHC
eukprot:COSAG01_NODE_159_length_23702_cov_119.507585_27_plen_99_part_00